jgi:hypothetical protein
VIRNAALLLILSPAPLAAQEGSPFFGEWCGVETRLWVGHDHIGFNQHLVCKPRRDPANGRAPTFSTRVTCANLYIEGEGEDVSPPRGAGGLHDLDHLHPQRPRHDVYRPR